MRSLQDALKFIPGLALLALGGLYLAGVASIASQLADANISRLVAFNYFSMEAILLRGIGAVATPSTGFVAVMFVVVIWAFHWAKGAQRSAAERPPVWVRRHRIGLRGTSVTFVLFVCGLLFTAVPADRVAGLLIILAFGGAVGATVITFRTKLAKYPGSDVAVFGATFVVTALFIAYVTPHSFPKGYVSLTSEGEVCGEVIFANADTVALIEGRVEPSPPIRVIPVSEIRSIVIQRAPVVRGPSLSEKLTGWSMVPRSDEVISDDTECPAGYDSGVS